MIKTSCLTLLLGSLWSASYAQVSGSPTMKDIGITLPNQTATTLQGHEWTSEKPGKIQLIQFVQAGHSANDQALLAVDEYVWKRLNDDPEIEISTIFIKSDDESSAAHHKRLKLSYDVVSDPDKSIMKASFNTPTVELPYFVVLNQEGETAFVSSGYSPGREAVLYQALQSVKNQDLQTLTQLLEIHSLKKRAGDVLGEQMPDIDVEKWMTEGSVEANGKYQLVEFWATWCGPCHRVVPKLQELHANQSDEVQIISITYEDPDLVAQYVKKKEIQYPIAIDTKRRLQSALAVNSFPSGFLVNPEGKIIWKGNLVELLIIQDDGLNKLIEKDKAKRTDGKIDT